jgi:hypothetical protein
MTVPGFPMFAVDYNASIATLQSNLDSYAGGASLVASGSALPNGPVTLTWPEGSTHPAIMFDGSGLEGGFVTTEIVSTPSSAVGLPKGLGRNFPDNGIALPFTLYGWASCTPVGLSPSEAQDRAIRHLAIREQQAVETAVFAGDLGNIPNLSGVNGAPPATDLGEYQTPEDALATIEEKMVETLPGQGVIWMSRWMASLLKNRLEFHGGQAFTKLGTPVIISSGMGGVQERLYGTLMPFGYRSDIFTSSNRPGDLFDLPNNDLYAIAERTYLIGWDPCGVLFTSYVPDEG